MSGQLLTLASNVIGIKLMDPFTVYVSDCEVVYIVCPVFVLWVNMCCYAFIGFLQQCHQDKCDRLKKILIIFSIA